MQKNSLGIPVAIVIAAGIIAFAIYKNGSTTPAPAQTESNTETPEQQEVVMEPVTEKDHIRGNPNAPIMLVEYSDYDCPFCKNFHDTMMRIMAEYGTDGTVAWVYRHFPIDSLHPNARQIAAAAECVAELGGNEAFWTFSDLIFNERNTNELTDVSRLPAYAVTAGVDEGQFTLCANSGKYDAAIEADVQEAIAAGGRGTPYTIVLVGDQQVGVISGAQPYPTVRQNIEQLIEQITGR